MGPGQIPRGVLLFCQLRQTCESVRQSAARATAAAHDLDCHLALFAIASKADDNGIRSGVSELNVAGPSVTNSLDPLTPTPPHPRVTALTFQSQQSSGVFSSQARGFSSQAVQNSNPRQKSYDKQVRDVRKKYIEELVEKRRRDQAFEQKRKEILAARIAQQKEAQLAATRAGAEEKERLLEEKRQQREVRRLEGQERNQQIKAMIQEVRDEAKEMIVASSKGWVANEEELRVRLEFELDNPQLL